MRGSESHYGRTACRHARIYVGRGSNRSGEAHLPGLHRHSAVAKAPRTHLVMRNVLIKH